MRDVFSNATDFKVRVTVRKLKNNDEDNISVVVDKDGYLSYGGYNIYIVSDTSKIWIDCCKSEKTALKKADKIKEYIKEK